MRKNLETAVSIIKQKKLFIFLSISAVLFIVFYFFSLKVKQQRFTKINFDTTIRLQYKIPDRFGETFEDLSFFVSPVMSAVGVSILTLVACIDVRNKKIRWKGLIIPLAFLLLVGAEVYGKDRVESPAPPYFMIKNPTTIFPKYHVIDQYSYPSGHAARIEFITVIAGILAWKFVYKKTGLPGIAGMVSIILLSILSVSVGKVYLGHHWFSDIIGGWLISTGCISLVTAFFI